MTGRKMHFRIWASFLLILAIAMPVTMAISWLFGATPPTPHYARRMAAIIVTDAMKLPPEERNGRLEEIGSKFEAGIGLFDENGKPLASSGMAPPLPERRKPEGTFFHSSKGWGMAFRTDDGYWITVSHSGAKHNPFRFIFSLAVFLGMLFIGVYFLARRLTGRLARLQKAVSAWDAHSEPAPVPVEGEDEVARLAKSFNEAGERIASLLARQRALLAGASHELRTPLARIRLAAEMMAESDYKAKRESALAGVREDIEELDGLVDDILFAARLDDRSHPRLKTETVDLFRAASQAAAGYGVEAEGSPVLVDGDEKNLRRLVANLLENAAKHAPQEPPVLKVEAEGELAVLTVSDRGPGLSQEERERVFDPFFRSEGASSAEGYGLGLFIVMRIAKRHGGHAACLPRQGGGTVFRLRLPLHREGSPKAT